MKRLAILVVFFIVNFSYAQVANDDCANAILITPSSTCSPVSGTLQNATTSSMAPPCLGNNDVFYKFVAPSTSAMITVGGSAGLDVIVSLYSSCGASAMFLYCINGSGLGGTETLNATSLSSGSTYYVQVQSANGTLPITYTFNICVVSLFPPANDECANAQVITPSLLGNPVAGTLLNSTVSSNVAACYGYYPNRDVFYKFTAISDNATISVTGSSGLDVSIGLLSDCSNNSANIYCMDYYGYGATETIYASGLVVGATYYVKVQAYEYAPATYTFDISVQSVSTIIPANDNCANAIELIPSPTCSPVSGELINAGNSSLTGTCSGNNDVFYKFEASAATATVYVAPSSGADVAVNVFSSCTGGFIACSDVAGAGSNEQVDLTGLVENNTYIIQVQNSGSGVSSTTDFTICVIGATPATPVNDECAGALTIYPDPVYTPITGTVKRATKSTVTSSCYGNSDVFYKFTAGARTATITVVGSSGFDPVVGLFRACGTSYEDCVDFNYNAGGTEVMTPDNLIVGQTYYIKVQDYSNTLPTTVTFTVAVQSTPIATATDAALSVQQISLFPNPTQNILNVQNIQMETTIELVDVRGRVLLQKTISTDEQMDLSEFAAGVYIMKLSVDGVVENRRVVISK